VVGVFACGVGGELLDGDPAVLAMVPDSAPAVVSQALEDVDLLCAQRLEPVELVADRHADVAAVDRELRRVIRLEEWLVLVEYPARACQRTFLGVGEMGDHLDDRPLARCRALPK
jgi:hypothetical protein